MKKMISALFMLMISASFFCAQAADPDLPDYKSAKLVLDTKCVQCHSSELKLSFFGKTPIIKQILTREHKDATEAFSVSDLDKPGYLSAKRLVELESVVSNGSMPPFDYRLFHRKSKLTAADKQALLAWIADAKGKTQPS